MEIIGKIVEVLPEASGVSQAGRSWKKREYVLETLESYPKKIFFDFFGDRADLFPLQIGQTIKLTFDIESRKFNDRWFTSIRGLKAEDPNQGVAPQQGYAAPQQPYQPTQQGYQAPQQAPFPGAPAAPAYGQPAPGAVPPPPAIESAPNEDLPF